MAFSSFTATANGMTIHDGQNYIMSPEGLDLATVVYRRTQVTSPFVEGRFTTNRVRDAVESTIQIDVLGSSQANLQANITALVNAFTADEFVLTVTIDGTSWSWNCEAADYAMIWDHPRMHARRIPMRFSFQRDPEPASGPV